MSDKLTFKNIITAEQQKLYFKDLLLKINEQSLSYKIYPEKENWFKAFELTEFNDVKIVLIGQDPYHNPNQAMGLAFAVNEGVKLPPSLANIYKEIENEFNVKMPNHGNLTSWAKQGVLLINTILTVNHNQPLSHKDFGWEIFSRKIIKKLQKKEFVIYLLLGNHAKSYIKYITNENHLIIQTSHPSPLSNYRGFSGSNIFKDANKALIEKGYEPINWHII